MFEFFFSPLEQFEIFAVFPGFSSFVAKWAFLFFIFKKKLFVTMTNYFLVVFFVLMFFVIFVFSVFSQAIGHYYHLTWWSYYGAPEPIRICRSWVRIIRLKKKYLPSGYFYMFEACYVFFLNMLSQQVDPNKGIEPYLPLTVTIFLTILLCNLVGLVPYSFTVTSHIMTTFTLSFSLFLGLTILAFYRHGLKWAANFFVPKGVPSFLIPFLVVIEIISYLSRMFSLSIRLFANMMSGHALLFILSSFVIKIQKGFHAHLFLDLLCLVPLILVFIISFLELGIAFLQAYVFTVLFTIYFNDCFNMGGH